MCVCTTHYLGGGTALGLQQKKKQKEKGDFADLSLRTDRQALHIRKEQLSAGVFMSNDLKPIVFVLNVTTFF